MGAGVRARIGPHRYRDSVELPGYYALQVRLHLAHRLVPERRDVLWIALIGFGWLLCGSHRGFVSSVER